MISSSKWQRPFAYPWRRPAWAAMAAVSGLVAGFLYLQTIAPGSGSGDGDSTTTTRGHQEQAGAHWPGQVRTADNQPETPAESIISGAVFDNRGGLLPPGILVAAELAGKPGNSPSSTGPGRDVWRTATDSRGQFTFQSVQAGGHYLLSVEDSKAFHGTRQIVRAGMVNAELRVQAIRSVRVYGNILDENGGERKDAGVRVLDDYAVSLSNSAGSYEINIEPIGVERPSVLEFQHLHYRSQRARVPAALASGWVAAGPEGLSLGLENITGRGAQTVARDGAMAMEME